MREGETRGENDLGLEGEGVAWGVGDVGELEGKVELVVKASNARGLDEASQVLGRRVALLVVLVEARAGG